MSKKNIKYYFYDIFDTILSRKVQPEYVKKVWATNICKIFSLAISSIELYEIRQNVEIELGQISVSKGFDCEITYKDIISEIYKKIDLKVPYNRFYSICEKEEINIESNVLYVNEDIFNQIKTHKKNKCKVYCVSDMYLSKKMLQTIFSNLNIIDYFDDIFVSCEYMLNKRSGKLYETVIKKLKVNPEECMMTGDSKEKDYENAIKVGLNATHIDRNDLYRKYEEFINNNDYTKIPDQLYSLSIENNKVFNNMIFSLYNFVDKIYFKLKEMEFDEVFFLAREGEFLKRLFDYYVDNIYNEKIKSHYLYVSRKATYLPSLNPLDKEDFSYLLNQYGSLSVREFLSSLNLSSDDIDLIEKDMKNISFDNKTEVFKKSSEYKALRKSNVFQKIYEKNRSEQNTLFKKYIKQYTKNKRIMVIDIGWNGSIQDNIQKILGRDYEVHGSYFGLCLRNSKYSGNKYGLVFSNDPYENKQYRLYYENRTIYEILCGASHGSANKYVLKDDKVEVELFSKEEEKNIYNSLVKPSQDEMFTTYKEIVNILNNKYFDNNRVDKVFNLIQYNLLYLPSKEQLELFNKIYHYENFGAFGFTTFTNNGLSVGKWIKENIKFFIKYGSYFNDAFWPVLKLYNNKMYIPYLIYRSRRKKRYKRSNLF